MKLHEVFPSRFMEARELDGEPRTLTIDRYETCVPVGREGQLKTVLYFKETGDRGLVLNRTNGNRIGAHHGEELNKWAGCKITIVPSTCDLEGKTVNCIRVKE